MVATDDLIEAFDDLGYTLEDPKVIDRLCSLCDLYGVDENKVSCEYLAYAKKKQLQAPTFEIVEQFDQEVLKSLQTHIKENLKRNVLDSTNIDSWVDDQEEEILGTYGTPKSGARSKRQITPEAVGNKRRFGVDLCNETFSPDSLVSSQTPNGKK